MNRIDISLDSKATHYCIWCGLTMKGHEELECCAHEGDLCEPQKREKEAPVVEVSQDYVIHITSESCDDYGIHRFPKKPSDAELEAYLRNLYPGDFPN